MNESINQSVSLLAKQGHCKIKHLISVPSLKKLITNLDPHQTEWRKQAVIMEGGQLGTWLLRVFAHVTRLKQL
jgi:hypothetical protein